MEPDVSIQFTQSAQHTVFRHFIMMTVKIHIILHVHIME